MSQQPEALRLADALSRLRIIDEVGSDNPLARDAAAELRRLHEVEREARFAFMEGYESVKDEYRARITALETANKELLEALKLALFQIDNQCDVSIDEWIACRDKARAAIAKHGGAHD